VREAPTNYRRNPHEQVKAADSLYSYFHNSDYSNEYSSDPGLDYTDTLYYHPDISNCSWCIPFSGVSPQPGNSQPRLNPWWDRIPEQKLPEPTESKKETQNEVSQTEPTFNTCEGGRARTDQGDPSTHYPPNPLTMESFYRWYAQQRMSHHQPLLLIRTTNSIENSWGGRGHPQFWIWLRHHETQDVLERRNLLTRDHYRHTNESEAKPNSEHTEMNTRTPWLADEKIEETPSTVYSSASTPSKRSNSLLVTTRTSCRMII
jgi:hypothetical protein